MLGGSGQIWVFKSFTGQKRQKCKSLKIGDFFGAFCQSFKICKSSPQVVEHISTGAPYLNKLVSCRKEGSIVGTYIIPSWFVEDINLEKMSKKTQILNFFEATFLSTFNH